VKRLFEITNSFYGYSYVRAYAWVEDVDKALRLAREKFKEKEQGFYDPRPKYWENLKAKKLFCADVGAFCTNPSDEGWEIQ